MITGNFTFETIEDAYYTEQMQQTGDGAQPVGSHMLQVVTDEDTYFVPNGAFRPDNPTLQLFGYYGTSPSRYEDDLPGQPIPIDSDPAIEKFIAEEVFSNGTWSLEQADWIETDG